MHDMFHPYIIQVLIAQCLDTGAFSPVMPNKEYLKLSYLSAICAP